MPPACLCGGAAAARVLAGVPSDLARPPAFVATRCAARALAECQQVGVWGALQHVRQHGKAEAVSGVKKKGPARRRSEESRSQLGVTDVGDRGSNQVAWTGSSAGRLCRHRCMRCVEHELCPLPAQVHLKADSAPPAQAPPAAPKCGSRPRLPPPTPAHRLRRRPAGGSVPLPGRRLSRRPVPLAGRSLQAGRGCA